MWVEMLTLTQKKPKHFRHPPREDVSWNTNDYICVMIEKVILLVRMWVEIFWSSEPLACRSIILLVRMWVEIYTQVEMVSASPLSSSSWGCELKYFYIFQKLLKGFVILLVRMWVEIITPMLNSPFYMSSSSWGCELKCYKWRSYCFSWRSSSSWGCELKYIPRTHYQISA